MHGGVANLAGMAGFRSDSRRALVDWSAAEQSIGFLLPSDYCDFVDVFGAGAFHNELSIIPPRRHLLRSSDSADFSLIIRYNTTEIGRALTEMREDFPEAYPYPIYPEAGGLLAWARNPNSDHCFWLMEGEDPDRWPVVVWYRNRRVGEWWKKYDLCMSEFLLKVLLEDSEDFGGLLASADDPRIWVPRD